MRDVQTVWLPRATAPPEPVDPRLIRLKQMVLDAVTSTDLERTRQRSQRSRIV
jgi:hypothetical protein